MYSVVNEPLLDNSCRLNGIWDPLVDSNLLTAVAMKSVTALVNIFQLNADNHRVTSQNLYLPGFCVSDDIFSFRFSMVIMIG